MHRRRQWVHPRVADNLAFVRKNRRPSYTLAVIHSKAIDDKRKRFLDYCAKIIYQYRLKIRLQKNHYKEIRHRSTS